MSPCSPFNEHRRLICLRQRPNGLIVIFPPCTAGSELTLLTVCELSDKGDTHETHEQSTKGTGLRYGATETRWRPYLLTCGTMTSVLCVFVFFSITVGMEMKTGSWCCKKKNGRI